MSNTLLQALRKRSDIKGPARAILVVLADHADNDGVCWPAHSTIARESGLGQSTVRKHLLILRDAGHVVWEERITPLGDKDSNLYRIILERGALDGTPPSRDRQPPPWDDLPVGRDVAGGGSQGSYEATLEPSNGSNNKAPHDSNSAPVGTALKRQSAMITWEEAKKIAFDLHEVGRHDHNSPIGMFPPEEIESWAKDWHIKNEATGGMLNGSKIVNPKAALESYLRSCSQRQSKRFKETRDPKAPGAGEPPF